LDTRRDGGGAFSGNYRTADRRPRENDAGHETIG